MNEKKNPSRLPAYAYGVPSLYVCSLMTGRCTKNGLRLEGTTGRCGGAARERHRGRHARTLDTPFSVLPACPHQHHRASSTVIKAIRYEWSRFWEIGRSGNTKMTVQVQCLQLRSQRAEQIKTLEQVGAGYSFAMQLSSW